MRLQQLRLDGTSVPVERVVYDPSEDVYGQSAETAVFRYLVIGLGHKLRRMPEGTYGFDLYDETVQKWISVERRKNWKDGKVFPFATIHIPTRRGESFRNRPSSVHWAVSNDLKWAMTIEAEDILSARIIRADNRRAKAEPFYDVSSAKGQLVEL